METRNSWGIVYVAAIFAALAIGTAFAISYFEKQAKIAQVVAITKNFPDWQTVSNTAPTTTPETPAPVAEALSQDLLTGYNSLLDQGTFTAKERDAMLADIVKKHVTNPNIVPVIYSFDLNIATSTSVDTYLALLAVILNKSTEVKHSELNVFTATVTSDNTHGTPELVNDAVLYARIGAALLAMPVPPQLAKQHLEVVKSVGALANAVANMGTWQGDPIDALTMVDSFNKAQAYAENSLNNVLAAATPLQNKKS